MIVTYSPYIHAIADWLERCGVVVQLHAELEFGVAGRYVHEIPKILVDSPLDARTTLMTLAHEAGHWLGYLICPKPRSYQRERQAAVYGWYVLRWFDAPIARDEWIAEERECRAYARWVFSG